MADTHASLLKNNVKFRRSFSKNRPVPVSDLISVQKSSYDQFLQLDVPMEQRKSVGLQAVFNSVFPIKDFNGANDPNSSRCELQFMGYDLEEPKYDQEECRERGMTFSAPLKVTVRLAVWDVDPEGGRRRPHDMKEASVFFGEIPLMTENGTFIINGTERVIVSQLHRSPGIFFDEPTKSGSSGKSVFTARIIPNRGSWIDFEFDTKDILHVRIDRRRKLPATVLLRALEYSTEDMLNFFYQSERYFLTDKGWMKETTVDLLNIQNAAVDVVDAKGTVLVKKGTKFNKGAQNKLHAAGFIQKRTVRALDQRITELEIVTIPATEDELVQRFCAYDVVDMTSGRVIVECNGELTRDSLAKAMAAFEGAGMQPEFEVLFIDGKFVGSFLRDTLLADKIAHREEAVIEIYRRLRPGDPPSYQAALDHFYNLFFKVERYDLSAVGRLKLNQKLGLDTPLSTVTLTREDILKVVQYLINLKNKKGETDDIDHLGNRRVRAVGELLENQYRIGLVRMEKAIRERMSLSEIGTLTPTELINAKPVSAVVKEFFGSSQLSQFMDQTNPLSEVTHKRRLSALGPGGLTRDRAGYDVRDVHPTHYGRICPIETPEGPNIGLIASLATHAMVNDYGFIETPYIRVEGGTVVYFVQITDPGAVQPGEITACDLKTGRPLVQVPPTLAGAVVRKRALEELNAGRAEGKASFVPYAFPMSAWEEEEEKVDNRRRKHIIAEATVKVGPDGGLDAEQERTSYLEALKAVALAKNVDFDGVFSKVVDLEDRISYLESVAKVAAVTSVVAEHTARIGRAVKGEIDLSRVPILKPAEHHAYLSALRAFAAAVGIEVPTTTAEGTSVALIDAVADVLVPELSRVISEAPRGPVQSAAEAVENGFNRLRKEHESRLTLSARVEGEPNRARPRTVTLLDYSTSQLVSVAASLIPFLESDNANRALMGSNMQRQAVPLLRTSAPLVGTGMEKAVARDSGVTTTSRRSGLVEYVDGGRIVVRADVSAEEENDLVDDVDIYNMTKFTRSNQSTCINQRPVVRKGDRVLAGEVIADGPATETGELALGFNATVAFMPWQGYNFEDSILISEKLVQEDQFTSIHVEEFEVSARDTKLGKEEITRDIPNVGEDALANLDESGIIRIGAEVKAGDILVGKITPKGETQLSPEEKLLRAIFGEKAGDVRDTSGKVPPGVEGTVIGCQIFSREGVEKDARSLDIESWQVGRLLRDRDERILKAYDSAMRALARILEGRVAAQAVKAPNGAVVLAKGAKLDVHTLTSLRLPAQIWRTTAEGRRIIAALERARETRGRSFMAEHTPSKEGKSIRGLLKDDQEHVIGGATVTVHAVGTGAVSTTTDVDGSFSFTKLPSGRYTIMAETQSWGSVRLSGVDVPTGRMAEVTLELPRTVTLLKKIHDRQLGADRVELKGKRTGAEAPWGLTREVAVETYGPDAGVVLAAARAAGWVRDEPGWLSLFGGLVVQGEDSALTERMDAVFERLLGTTVRHESTEDPDRVSREGLLIEQYSAKEDRLSKGDDLSPGVIRSVKVYVAIKRKLSVGDKMAGRHGNKGVVSKILPIEDMPYLEDGTPVDIVLNPLGVPSRMNVGQILETHLGWAAKGMGEAIGRLLDSKQAVEALRDYLLKAFAGEHNAAAIDFLRDPATTDGQLRAFAEKYRKGVTTATPVFSGATEHEIRESLELGERERGDLANNVNAGQSILFDGRTGETFSNRVTVGVMYMLKLHHLVDDKIHARSIGPYSLVTQQPLGGKAQFGGQRLGEMEVWALEAYGAAYTLQEFLTVKSDDTTGRTRMYESIVKGDNVLNPGVPESFNVLVKELQALALDVELEEMPGAARAAKSVPNYGTDAGNEQRTSRN